MYYNGKLLSDSQFAVTAYHRVTRIVGESSDREGWMTDEERFAYADAHGGPHMAWLVRRVTDVCDAGCADGCLHRAKYVRVTNGHAILTSK